MTTLNKITLSNIRRFAENVEIEISQGATIVLAPNGTGKTSIFEGIEFALTGGVRRLGHPPLPIIRDQFDSARIRLDYNDDQFCEVNFHKDNEPIVTREHPTLFRGIERDNIPYLLRLTHLLNQSSKEWFVQSKSDEAASQLDSLSIGKDATIANSSVVSLKRAAGTILERLQLDFSTVDGELNQWNGLQARRKAAISPSNQNLTPKDEIINQILGLEQGLFPQGLIDEIAPIKAALAMLLRRYKQTEEAISNKILLLTRLRPSVEAFIKLSDNQTSIEKAIGEKASLLGQLDKKISDGNSQAAAVRNTSEKWHAEMQLRKNIEELLQQVSQLTSRIPALDEEKSKAEGEIAGLEKQHEDQTIKVAKNRAQIDLWQGIENEKLQYAHRLQQLTKLDEVVKSWAAAIDEIAAIRRSELSDANSRLQSIEELISPKLKSLAGKEQLLESAQQLLKGLTSSSDKLKEAVSQVAANLSPDATDCPVCNTKFEGNRLHDEVALSLSRLDKSLEPAHTAVKTAKKDVDDETKAIRILQEEKEKADVKVKEVENTIIQIERRVDTEYRVKFISDDFNTNKDKLDRERLTLEEINIDLARRQKELGDVISEVEQNKHEAELGQLHQKIIQSKERLQTANAKIEENTRLIENYRLRLQQQDYDDNNTKLLNAQQQYDKANSDLGKLQEIIKGDQAQHSIDKQHIGNQETELQQLKSRANEIAYEWKQRDLNGLPEMSLLEKELRKQEQEQDENKQRSKKAEILSAEIDKWESYESYFAVEKDIRAVIGEQSEDDYFASLTAKHAARKLKLESAKAKTSLINTFSRNLDTQLRSVNEKLASINPIWSKILRRLVIDPRFASTELNSYQSYRKNYAEVKVPMHNSGALVSQVASEAQITDIQFSFLLAMAQMYQWSPWKALLLDDPTQHHDLVHASAVFDLLRDYIADHRFQVVMATHDAVQAKFFKRKLENDGIPVSFYTLHATRVGVVAELN